jgi:hypothetical protein
MVNDDELERHMNRVETSSRRLRSDVPTVGGTDDGLESRVDEMQAAARQTHDELARRIRNVDDASADVAQVDELVDRMSSIEERLAAIEAELAD